MPSSDRAALSDDQRSMLELERQTWRHRGAKDQAVADLFGLTSTRYMQLLNRLIDEPAALAHDPLTVNRLRRLREHRATRRHQLVTDAPRRTGEAHV